MPGDQGCELCPLDAHLPADSHVCDVAGRDASTERVDAHPEQRGRVAKCVEEGFGLCRVCGHGLGSAVAAKTRRLGQTSTHPTRGLASNAVASATGLLELIDWDALPADVQQTIRLLGPLLIEERSRREVLDASGVTELDFARRIARAREAIVAQAFDHLDAVDPGQRELVMAEVDRLTKPA
jgi:hypothetical protein